MRRILKAARSEILEDLLRRTVDESALEGLDWRRLTGLVLQAIAQPRRAVRIFEEVGAAPLREGLAAWVDALQRARDHLRGAGGVDAAALRRGLEEILGGA